MDKSPKNNLNKADWQSWKAETLIYNISPVVIVFLSTLYANFLLTGGLPDAKVIIAAIGAAYGSLLAALLNLFGKFKAGH